MKIAKSIAGTSQFIAQVFVVLVITLLLLEASLQVMSLFVNKESRVDKTGHVTGTRSYTIVTVGDSHTWGMFVEKPQAWPSVLQKLFDTHHYSVKVINLAYPGTNSMTINESFQSILDATNPDFVLFMAGVNDYWTMPVFDQGRYTKVVQWLQVHSRAYKAFLILYEGHYKHSITSVDNLPRFVKERQSLSDDQLTSLIQGLVPKIHTQTMELNGEMINFGTDLVRDKAKADQIKKVLHQQYASTIHYSVSEMIKKAQGTHTQIILVTYPSPESGVAHINELMRDVAGKNHLTVVENELPKFVHCQENDDTCNGYLFSDQHPSSIGHELIAQHVFDAMKPLLDKQNPLHQ